MGPKSCWRKSMEEKKKRGALKYLLQMKNQFIWSKPAENSPRRRRRIGTMFATTVRCSQRCYISLTTVTFSLTTVTSPPVQRQCSLNDVRLSLFSLLDATLFSGRSTMCTGGGAAAAGGGSAFGHDTTQPHGGLSRFYAAPLRASTFAPHRWHEMLLVRPRFSAPQGFGGTRA